MRTRPTNFPGADDLNGTIALIAAGKAVDEIHAQILADSAVCRIVGERLLYNLRHPLKLDLSESLKWALEHYKHNPKVQIDREVKIDSRPVLEFSLRYVIRLMTLSIELIEAADRYRIKRMQRLSLVPPVAADLGEIKHATPNRASKKADAARARGFNGSAVSELSQKTDSTKTRYGNGHTPT
jgi:hypothetical protein